MDLIWQKDKKVIGFEIKSSGKWKNEFGKGLKILLTTGKIKQAYGVYLGTDSLKDGTISILPVMTFLKKLHAGEIFGDNTT